ncbi:hypothetical protein [Oceanibaculum pacificum]|uniref:Uncharacterized protein n=1 Tax=Oceanibaculum pacificum TaxID=580166 RepID=A0A154WG02_9PROT|nr:hypothetical protein [Oceanibaculum pacificum]KZD12450.1 hypothetical protein AUP43_04670 [Oceanibaculum pacificum]
MITLTNIHMQRLHAEAARLAEDAEHRLASAEKSDDPDDWDAWKEADGLAAGFRLALQEVVRQAAIPELPMSALSYDDWHAQYRPIDNAVDLIAPFEGTLFGTFGPELDAVRAADPLCVWTLVEWGDADNMYVLSGCHLVNRVGYFITDRPRVGDEPVGIFVD